MTSNRLLKALAICPVLLLFAFVAQAQKTITGKVTDEKGSPVIGASVVVKGGTTGTTSDASGNFSLTVPSTTTAITVSYIGYASQDVNVSSTSSVSVSLVPDNSSLSDIVVIGYGTTKRKDVTGAITSVQAKDFNKGVITTPDQLLQNKVPGLEITNNSGQPGSATTVKIRGNNSIRGGNNPIYVVDGVILDGRSARPSINLTGLGATPETNPLIYINPNDIASIDVLKDASAAAIYGSRGANGVIVITTKKGVAGQVKLEVNAGFGAFAGFMKKYEVLDASQYRAALQKYNVTNASDLDGGKSIDPQQEITQNRMSQNYSVAFSGGNDVGKFRASFLGSITPGFIKGTSLNRYLGNLGGQYKFLNKKLTFDFNLIAGHTTESIGAVTNDAGSTGNLISSVLQWNPTMPFTDPSTGYYVFPTNGSGNPLALIAGTDNSANVNTFLGNISANYEIIKGLDYKFLYAINHSSGYTKANVYGWLEGYSGLSGLGAAAIANAVLTSQTFTHTLNYNTDLTSNLHLNATAGFEYWKSNYSNNTFAASGFNTNLTQDAIINIPYTSMMQDANNRSLPSTYDDPTIELKSYFARAIFSYADKYYLTGTFRADGSSKFGKNNKYGYFPSVGAKWMISNEDFMKGSSLFSLLALRASWGITGNQEFPAGAAEEQFAFSSYNTAGQVNVANPNLKWESTSSYDFGLDFNLLKGRIYGGFDYYNKNTTDILFQSTAIQPAPASSYWINIPGNLMNSGFEISLGATIIQNTNFTWDLSVNFAHNKNLLKNFYAPGTKTPLKILTGAIDGQGVSGTLSQVITNNQPVNEFYLKPFGGFDDKGNQVGLDGAPLTTEDPIYAGNPNPTNLFGVSTSLQLKKFNLSINAGGASGYVIYNNTRTAVTNISGILQGRNIDEAAYNSAEQPSSSVGASTRFLESGNYIKLRNATLSYNVGNAGNYIKNLNIFVSGSNLFIITKFTGFDPEVNIDHSSGGYPSRSIEYVPYPTPRTITFGLNFSL
ncbi:MAG: SusC/RagA family TonB-linked outer membrane protein [Bacteroidetes bacterium]|nr:SusC/RagA family TonB-linked outer membrane protein [Bacteroidota bacterium]